MINANSPRGGIHHWLSMLQAHNIVRLFLALQADFRVSPILKLQAWCGLVYIFSPLDVLPELFTGIGVLDDIIVALIMMQAMLELSPRHVVDEHCRRLGLRPENVFISVGQTVREARSLYTFVREFGSGFRASVDSADAPVAGDASNMDGEHSGSRYSAYRDSGQED